jgi:RNA recognition motif-containing protein
MSKKIYVANLPYTVTSNDLKMTFSEIGKVVDARVITDRDTGKSKGFAFVEMENEEDGKKAIQELNGGELSGRTLIVKEAQPQAPRGERPERTSSYAPRGERPERTSSYAPKERSFNREESFTNDGAAGFTKYDIENRGNRRERSDNGNNYRRDKWN